MVTRRTFVKGGACALVALGSAPRFLLRAAAAAEGQRKVLVAIFQRGAVDGLSMVAPYGDRSYATGRPGIAIQAPRRGESERSVDLDGFFALHPALAPLMPLWENRSLAVVHACGSPDTTRSHFDAQDYMETGTPGVKSTPDGWLARAVKALPARGSAFRAVALGPSLPRCLRGEIGAVAMQNVADFDVRPGPNAAARQGFESMYEQGVRDLLYGTGRETFEAVKLLKSAGVARIAPQNGAEYPNGRLGQSLRQIAQLIRGDVGVEVAFADVGGWDTHVGQGNEKGQLANRLTDLGAAIAAFSRDLGDRMADVVVLTMSEFGRTVAENGNRGTDHGHATAMLVLGGNVHGGKVYGRWPGLAREQLFEGRDVAVTTDFRALFGEVASRHLGVASAASLFPGWRGPQAPLGLFA
ncbi:MAG: DUF1501 domain-containing protein [Candidatus Rokubacteria bacterium]|nr:DUF1501 domain-containing protein [Candidatus Rokubacteria bacterium]MBI3825201.1 DUF1501 domain-containing protein [Candidatus Rokubacteria bacterium]